MTKKINIDDVADVADGIKDRIDTLTKELNEHNYNYYVLSEPSISDYEFDQLLKELEELEIKYPELYDANSPTKRVGGDITKSFETVLHKYPMLSLSNSYSKDDIADFDQRVKKIIDETYLITLVNIKKFIIVQ